MHIQEPDYALQLSNGRKGFLGISWGPGKQDTCFHSSASIIIQSYNHYTHSPSIISSNSTLQQHVPMLQGMSMGGGLVLFTLEKLI